MNLGPACAVPWRPIIPITLGVRCPGRCCSRLISKPPRDAATTTRPLSVPRVWKHFDRKAAAATEQPMRDSATTRIVYQCACAHAEKHAEDSGGGGGGGSLQTLSSTNL